MIEGYKTRSYEQRIEKLGITTLEDRFYRADMIQVYKILNDSKNIYPANFLGLSNRAGRKNSLKLFKRRSYGDISKYKIPRYKIFLRHSNHFFVKSVKYFTEGSTNQFVQNF